MSELALALNMVAGILWLAVTMGLFRHPPETGLGWSKTARRTLWTTLSLLALGAGAWGVPIGTRTARAQPPDEDAGRPTETTSTFLRTPFAVVERATESDRDGRTLRDNRRETLQIPVGLLVFLGATLWLRRRERQPRPTDPARRAATVAILVACGSVWACSRSPQPDVDGGVEAQRPERLILDVVWDTLVRIHAGVGDTLLFSASSPVADENGFSVVDYYGFRIARFDWNGNLQGYIGGRGEGPGEFTGLRRLDIDGHGILWALDVQNARLSGFARDGQIVDEISLSGLDHVPSDFAARYDGRAFHVMLSPERLEPRVVDRTGSVAKGPAIDLEEGPRAHGLALQGVVTRTDTLGGWAFALGAGDGIIPMRDGTWDGRRLRYPEFVPFPAQDRIVARDGATRRAVTRITDPRFSILSADAYDGTLYAVFMGATAEAGRLLERWDLTRGAYLDTVLLPKAGYIAVWQDRIVVAATNPEPEVLVLRARDPG